MIAISYPGYATDARKVACSPECKAGYKRAWTREWERQKREERKAA